MCPLYWDLSYCLLYSLYPKTAFCYFSFVVLIVATIEYCQVSPSYFSVAKMCSHYPYRFYCLLNQILGTLISNAVGRLMCRSFSDLKASFLNRSLVDNTAITTIMSIPQICSWIESLFSCLQWYFRNGCCPIFQTL